MLRWGRIEASGGFLLLTATLYYLDGDGVVAWALLACALHELGHYAAVRLLGGRVEFLRLTCVGAEMRLSARRMLTPGRQLLAVLAGPAVNLLLALLGARAAEWAGERAYLFAGLNLALGVFNLLPVEQLDGGRALKSLLVLLGMGRGAEQAAQLSSLALAGALAVGGSVLLLEGKANVTLPLTGVWLLLSAARASRNSAPAPGGRPRRERRTDRGAGCGRI